MSRSPCSCAWALRPSEGHRQAARPEAACDRDRAGDSNEKLVLELAQILEKGDAAAFERLIVTEKLEPFCHFFCFWLCQIRYRLLCRWMCDPRIEAIPSLATEIASAGHALRVLVTNEKAFEQAVAGAQSGDPAEIRAAIDSVS